ncbi:MAG: hypothetical protein ACP5UA_14235 [Candidatus Hydrogenedens sp.]
MQAVFKIFYSQTYSSSKRPIVPNDFVFPKELTRLYLSKLPIALSRFLDGPKKFGAL